MTMFVFVYFVLYVPWFMFTNCSEEQIVSWPSSPSGIRNISNMILIWDGQVLLISGLNHLYALNTTSFQLIHDVVTGPSDGTDNVMKNVIFNKTEQDTVGYITTCSSLHSYCNIRKESDISNVVNRLEEPIKSEGVQAFMTFYERPGGIRQLDKFLFVACPHAEVQENRCEKPGIIWYENSGNDKPEPWYGFKSFNDTPILTEKYVDSFTVDKYRIFFSIQSDKQTRERKSRVAQVCQNYIEGQYTTSFTYADMPIQCGRLKEIKAVRKIMFGTETVFIALFSDSVTSSVCVYSMVETIQKFVDNIKDCYSGRRVSDDKDYISLQTSDIPCNSVYNRAYLSKPNDYFLCNDDKLYNWQQVVGTQLLSKEPAVTYNMSLTALTLTVVDSKIIAFLGTTYGDILKAVVYPSNSTNYIQQPIIPNIDVVKKDMHTSSDGQHIFALNETKVFKIPVQSCSGFSTCSECLGSNDPYCGWCFLEERCSTKDACPNRKWFSASRDEKCPHIGTITPTVMSVNELKLLEMRVSQKLQDVDVSCLFHSEEVGSDFDQIQTAEVSEDTVKCRPTNELAVENKIQGYLNVIVTILVNNSATTIQGRFDIFQCETFERCNNCTEERWRCKWCAYTNKCKNDDSSCDYHSIEPGEECPRITNYTVVKGGDDDVQDMTGSVYLSRGRNYTINITGTNLMEPRTTPNSLTYKCKVVVSGTQVLWFNRTHFNNGSLVCNLEKEEMSKITSLEDEVDAKIQVTWGDSPIYGKTLSVNVYACEGLPKPDDNCGHCKSFAISKPYYNCQWCMTKCVDSTETCNSLACGRPRIIKVFPLSAHINATTLITVTGVNLGSVYNDTVDSVTVAGIPCASVESGYDPGLKIECILPPSNKVMHGSVIVTMKDNQRGNFSSLFHFRVPKVTSITPFLGPMSGGTIVTILGELLDTGRNLSVSIGGKSCRVNTSQEGWSPTKRVCTTTAGDKNEQDKHLDVNVEFDGASADVVENVNYSYVQDPNIISISPYKSFKSGGRKLTIKGDNLYSIQKPKIYAVVDNKRLKSEDCDRNDSIGVIYCHSPRYTEMGRRRRKRSGRTSRAMIGFEMDDVSSVKAENLPSGISLLVYFEDPLVENFTEDKVYTEFLSVKGERFKVAADENDVVIKIGCEKCNVRSMTDDVIICQPPMEEPKCSHLVKNHKLTVKVNIGFLKRNVGSIIYDDNKQQDGPGRKTEEYIIAGGVVGSLLLCLGIFTAIIFVMWRKRKLMKEEKVGLEYKMDKLEAKFRNQCREEFAALQTAVSDLTSDLEGGNVLFREYDVYASKTLFSSQKSDVLTNPPTVCTEQTQQAMDTLKGLLRNRQFLLMLIKTLEKEKYFTIHDKSNVATILMILNHDNMEYVTGILTTLIDDLIDKNIASQTPKLLLRRSECVAEKLLTHWLSICLYHYLKERSGSALYILYKAIKVQTEKGPIDYITNCGKYTLSEDKLFTSADTEINPVTLTLDVSHFDFIENKEKQISVQVLDCDTVSQAKGKMLEILYKNVPYSQRPSVHSTNLEVKEGDGGSKRLLNDEDASSTKDGIWKRINTLQHYKIQDGANVNLFLSVELKECFSAMPAGASPDSFIVGSVRKSKPIVRTISGSNFWHLTKKNHTDDEVQLASDLFLPRLLNTKGTLQKYIDDLFEAVLSVGSEPPIIIKFLFDYLDSAASRCGIKDPDVLHTWKCNSLLLRFWVNIIKNPEFVFDVHKPLIVDSCLSVVAQTLMDSCSTADLNLGPSSPSNKLLFAKDIPRYKGMVRQYFHEMTLSPAVSDQELNSYLTQKVSQKFYGKFNQTSAIIEMYKYASKYRNEINNQMNTTEAASPGTFSSITPKLVSVFKSMDANTAN